MSSTNAATPVELRVRWLSAALFTGVGLLLIGHLAGLAWLASDDYRMHPGIWLVYFDGENNLPALYSFALLLGCALLLALNAHVARRCRLGGHAHWFVLAGIFLLLAGDEALELHEAIGDLLDANAGTNTGDKTGGLLHFSWVIPYAVATALVALSYLRFLWTLPAVTRWRFIIAGGLYVGGAIGLEMLQGAVIGDCPDYCWQLMTLVTIEELLEMLGAALFARALLLHLADSGKLLRLIPD